MDVLAPLFNFLNTAAVAILAGTISYAAGRGMKKQEWRLTILREKSAARQRLFAEFLAEANRLVISTIDQRYSKAADLCELTRINSEIELMASDKTASIALLICTHIVDLQEAGDGKEVQIKTSYPDLRKQFIANAKLEIAKLDA